MCDAICCPCVGHRDIAERMGDNAQLWCLSTFILYFTFPIVCFHYNFFYYYYFHCYIFIRAHWCLPACNGTRFEKRMVSLEVSWVTASLPTAVFLVQLFKWRKKSEPCHLCNEGMIVFACRYINMICLWDLLVRKATVEQHRGARLFLIGYWNFFCKLLKIFEWAGSNEYWWNAGFDGRHSGFIAGRLFGRALDTFDPHPGVCDPSVLEARNRRSFVTVEDELVARARFHFLFVAEGGVEVVVLHERQISHVFDQLEGMIGWRVSRRSSWSIVKHVQRVRHISNAMAWNTRIHWSTQ